MFICLLCKNNEFISKRLLSGHIRRAHKLTAQQYEEQFGLVKLCKKCNKKLLKNNQSGFCTLHRDRFGSNNPFFGKHHTISNKTREKLGKSSKAKWEDQDYRLRVIKGISKPRCKGFGAEQSKRVLAWYLKNPNQRDLRSKQMKQSWKDGKIVFKMHSSNASKLEKELFSELEKMELDISKNSIKLRNGKWVIPDIIVNTRPLIIEFFGDFWHANPKFYNENSILHHNVTAKQIWQSDAKRIENIEKLGFFVMVVWEDEFQKHKQRVLNKIENLINWEDCAF